MNQIFGMEAEQQINALRKNGWVFENEEEARTILNNVSLVALLPKSMEPFYSRVI